MTGLENGKAGGWQSLLAYADGKDNDLLAVRLSTAACMATPTLACHCVYLNNNR